MHYPGTPNFLQKNLLEKPENWFKMSVEELTTTLHQIHANSEQLRAGGGGGGAVSANFTHTHSVPTNVCRSFSVYGVCNVRKNGGVCNWQHPRQFAGGNAHNTQRTHAHKVNADPLKGGGELFHRHFEPILRFFKQIFLQKITVLGVPG